MPRLALETIYLCREPSRGRLLVLWLTGRLFPPLAIVKYLL